MIVDNIFLSFYFLKLLELGVDLVIYLVIKYLVGYLEFLVGVVIVNDLCLVDWVYFV